MLEINPDKVAANKLLEGFFLEGFKLCYSGNREARDSDNLKSINQNGDLAGEKINKEVKLGRIVGPLAVRPIHNSIISPIGLVSKAQPRKLTLIQHLPFPEGASINNGIGREFCKVHYKSFDEAVRLVVEIGKGL